MYKKYFLTLFMCFCVVAVSAQFSGGGTGTQADPYGIVTPSDLDNLRNYTGVDYADTCFQLLNDIDLYDFLDTTTNGWQPIGDENNKFYGKLQGNGHAITNLWMNFYNTGLSYFGLFGQIRNACINNLSIVVQNDKSIHAYRPSIVVNNVFTVGVLAGYAYSSSIINCTTQGTIWKYSAVSGNNSYNLVSSVGGLVGQIAGSNTVIETCCSMVNIADTTYSTNSNNTTLNVGGLIGLISGQNHHITSCYAIGRIISYLTGSNIYAGSYSGGLIGRMEGQSISIEKCYSDVKMVTRTKSNYSNYYNTTGGLIGFVSNDDVNIDNINNITDCYAIGGIVSSGYRIYLGGIIGCQNAPEGRNTILTKNCYYAGAVNTNSCTSLTIGGIVGLRNGYGTISNCYYNQDSVATNSIVGGMILNNIETSESYTTHEMRIQSNFANWDFQDTWGIIEGITYPYFQNIPQFWTPEVSYDTICAGEDYIVFPFYIENVTENIFLIDSLTNNDSITFRTLIVRQPIEIADTIILCESELPFYYALADTTFEVGSPEDSVFLFRVSTQEGCDSIITLQLTIRHPQQITHTLIGCNSLTWNNETYTATGIYVQNFSCDSIVTLNVTIGIDYNIAIVDTVLRGETYTDNGFNISADSTQILGTIVETQNFASLHGCDSIVTLTLYVVSGSGINSQLLDNEITIYPNPAYDYVTISVPATIMVRQISVYDICGALVLRNNNTLTINTSDLQQGVYLMTIVTDKGTVTRKLVVGIT